MIRPLTICTLFAVLFPLCGGNPIRNASFELGSGDWNVVRFSMKNTGFIAPFSDAEESVHGKRSLRIDNPNADTIELTGQEIALKKGRTYTLSWYAKSSKPLCLRGAVIAEDQDWFVYSSFTDISPEWTRFRCTFTVGKDSVFIPRFTWGNWNGTASSATLWIDAVQIDEGTEPTDFQVRKDVELTAEMDTRLSFDKQPLTLTVTAVNNTKQRKTIPVHFSLADTVFPEYAEPLPKRILAIPAESTAKLTFRIRPSRYGHMKLHEKNKLCPSLFFAVIPRPAADSFNPAAAHMTGLEYNFSQVPHTHTDLTHCIRQMGASQEENLAFFRNCGISLLRVGNLGTAFSWNRIEKTPGKFDWAETDQQIALAQKYNLQLMPVLGNMFYLRDRPQKKRSWSRLPDFIIRNGKLHPEPKQRWDGVLPAHNDWRAYVAAFASHCKGKIAAYEITNEPNITIPAEHYVKYVKIAAEEIRKADPKALVIGGCLTADYDGKLEHYLSLLNSSGALAMCDALSFHPYSSRLDGSSYSAAANIQYLKEKTGNKTLWNSELYYLWDPPKQNYNKEAILFSGMRPHHLFRRFAIDFGEGVMQSIPLSSDHLLMADGDSNWKGSPVFLTASLIPNAMYMAYAAASALFSGCRSEGNVETPSGVTCYRFRHRNSKKFAVCWKKTADETAKITLPHDLEVRDLFGNPITHHGELALSENPIILHLPADGTFPVQFIR